VGFGVQDEIFGKESEHELGWNEGEVGVGVEERVLKGHKFGKKDLRWFSHTLKFSNGSKCHQKQYFSQNITR